MTGFQGLLEPKFYGDSVYKFKKIVGRIDFSDHSLQKNRIQQWMLCDRLRAWWLTQ